MEENKRISDLFESARNEAPKISFEDMKKHVIATSTVGGVGIIAKWAATSFKFKAIIMITTLSTLTISGILIATQLTSTTEIVEAKTDEISKSVTEYIEISNVDGIKKTVLFNENDKVLEILIDSTKKIHPPTLINSKVELTTKAPEMIQNRVEPNDQLIKLKENAPIVLISTDSLNKKEFIITEKTTKEELNNIAKQARAAGIIFDYSTRIRNNSIKKVKLDMQITTGGTNDWRASVTGNTFTYSFGWWEDDNGRAIRFLQTHKKFIGLIQEASSE